MKMHFDIFGAVFVLSLMVGAIATTTAKAKVFLAVREWIKSQSNFFGYLVSCAYCTCHWLSIAIVLIYQPVIVEKYILLDLVVSIFAMVAMSAITSGLIMFLIPFQGDAQNEPVLELKEKDAPFSGDGVFSGRRDNSSQPKR